MRASPNGSRGGSSNARLTRNGAIIGLVLILVVILFVSHANAASRQFYESSSEGESSYSGGTTYQDKATLTFTPDANSNYLIIATWQHKSNSLSYGVKSRLYDSTGSATLSEQIYIPKDTTDYIPAGAAVNVSFGASPPSQTYKIQYACNSNFPTVYIRYARIIAIKLGTNDVTNSSTGRSTYSASTTHQDKVIKTFTPGSLGQYLVIGSCVFDGSSSSYDTEIDIDVDGTQYGLTNVEAASSTNRLGYIWFQNVSLSAASHTVKLQYATESTSNTAGCAYAYLDILRLDDFPGSIASSTDSPTVDSDAVKDHALTSDFSSSAATSHIILSCAKQNGASTNVGELVGLYEGSTDKGEDVLEPKDTTNYNPYFAILYKTDPENTYYIDVTTESALNNAVCDDPRIFGLQLNATCTDPPVANFTANQTSICANGFVGFTDTSTNTPTSWQWQWGDGTANGTTQNPTHQYTGAGSYSVNLTATNACGGNTTSKLSYITVGAAPAASFTANVTDGCTPHPVHFTDESTNTPTAWNWSFGDGNYSESQNPDHTYVGAGQYDVSLNASNSCGYDIAEQLFYITVGSTPVAEFSANVTSGCAPLNVGFTDESEGSGILSLAWDLNGDEVPDSYEANPKYTYTSPGTYTVKVNVSNDCGYSWKNKTAYISVGTAPTAAFSANVTSGCSPLDVLFTDASTGSPTSWSWDVNGDDIEDYSTQNPVHTYSVAGTYTVNMKASNACGNDYENKTSYVVVGSVPVANFTANQTIICSNDYVGFTDTSTNTPTSWQWQWGDGTANGTTQNPDHQYTGVGVYTVNLTATNSCGSNTTSKSSYITVNSAPTASFSANTTSGCGPLDIQFTDTSTGSPNAWFWDFGDETNTTDQNPTHQYATTGLFTVKLRASNSCGLSWSNQTNYINVTGLAPISDFSSNTTSGCSPLNVQFTDETTNTPTAWNWSFGDDTYSEVQNPTHQYTSVGSYTIKLKTTNSCGVSWKNQTDYITVTGVAPVAGFTANQTSGCPPLSVAFTDTSTGTPTSWLWEWDDGSPNGTTQNPVHDFADTGTYTIKLTATNSCGSDSEEKVDYITVSIGAPVTDFHVNTTSGCAPLSVQFTDDSTNTPTSWLWEWDDETPNGTTQNPVHQFVNPGTYTIKLTAGNGCGSDSEEKIDYITVNPPAPVADFTANETSGCPPLSIAFTDTSTNTPTSWLWEWDDETPNSTDQNPVHQFTSAGTYTIKLTATNGCGFDSEEKINYITVSSGPPVADFHVNTTSGCPPLSVQFTDDSTNTPTSWLWEWDDGSPNGTTQNPVHQFTNPGTYTIKLTAGNGCGSDSEEKIDYITVSVGPPVTDFHVNTTSGCPPLSVQFTDDSTNTPTSWLWEWDDGSPNGTTQNPVHQFTNAGTYTIKLTSGNSCGNDSEEKIDYITVNNPPPSADFSANTTEGCPPLSVAFTDLSTNTPTSWDWSWDDGSPNSTTQNPVHQFNESGTYTVTLTAINGCGQDTEEKVDYITVLVGEPTADFHANQTSGCPPLIVQFTDDTTGSPTAWNWSFGDGSANSTEQNPIHQFNNSGIFDIKLTASNSCGEGYKERVGYITVSTGAPVAGFTSNVTEGCIPFSVQFTDTSTNSPTSWLWEWGDETANSTDQNPVHEFTAVGDYTIKLTAGNGCGSDSEEKVEYIHAYTATADFHAVPVYGEYPLFVQFTDDSPDAVSWAWDIDNSGSTDYVTQNPGHTYTSAGTYTVKLTITSSHSCTDVETKTGYINVSEPAPPNPPTAAFTANTTSGYAPLSVLFTDESSGAPTSWCWDIDNDGDCDYITENPVHQYSTPGLYSVNLTVTNDDGSDSELKTNYINVTAPPGPTANFHANVTYGHPVLSVQFIDDSTGSPTSWEWSFGDSSENSTEQNPIHPYYFPGVYDVRLTVSNTQGESYKERLQYINVVPWPTTAPTPTPTQIGENITLQPTYYQGEGYIPWQIYVMLVVTNLVFFAHSVFGRRYPDITGTISTVMWFVLAYLSNMIGYYTVGLAAENESMIVVEPAVTVVHPPWLVWIMLMFAFSSLVWLLYILYILYFRPIEDRLNDPNLYKRTNQNYGNRWAGNNRYRNGRNRNGR